MTSVVVEASALVDALVGPDSLVVQAALGGRHLLAPAHIDAEALSALRGLRRRRHLSGPRCRDAIVDLADLPLERWPLTLDLLNRAFDLADTLTSYDALYVALAEALDVPLITRDAKLAATARRYVTVEFV